MTTSFTFKDVTSYMFKVLVAESLKLSNKRQVQFLVLAEDGFSFERKDNSKGFTSAVMNNKISEMKVFPSETLIPIDLI